MMQISYDTLHLILGGARSGKSAHALRCAEHSALEPVFIATAQAFDDEMTERIARHRGERDARWTTVECPLDLERTLTETRRHDRIVVVDCLTLWLSNMLLADLDIPKRIESLTEVLHDAQGATILVSNEVGMGLVPESALGRSFRDHQGRLNQAMARISTRVEFIAAGLALSLKS